jgi:AAA15 family ATPase/GTPase
VIEVLCQFNFKNFKSFYNEATLDMQATSISEHEESLLMDLDGQKFLPLAVIYGPNGGGKSTVLEAFAFLVNAVMHPIYMLKDEEKAKRKNSIKAVPFKFIRKSIEEPSEFEVFFRIKGAEYKYTLKLKKNVIVYESLFKQRINGKKASKLFVRDSNMGSIEVGQQLKSIDVTGVSETIPFLSYVKILKEIEVINEVVQWFDNCNMINYDNPFMDLRVFLPESDNGRNIMLKMLQEMDIDIFDYRVEELEGKDKIRIFTKHVVEDQEYELDLGEESSGTRKLFSFLPLIIEALQRGGVMIIDEMDAKLHPKLIRYIIELFSNPKSNPNKAQLIFTSHDLTTMKKEVFRRDEIWFVAKDKNQSSKLYSLVEIKDEDGKSIRKDATFDKQYLEGRYGADPYLRRCLNWEEEL